MLAYGVGWRTKVDKAKKEATDLANSASKVDLVSAQLQEHRLHVSENYASKSDQGDA